MLNPFYQNWFYIYKQVKEIAYIISLQRYTDPNYSTNKINFDGYSKLTRELTELIKTNLKDININEDLRFISVWRDKLQELVGIGGGVDIQSLADNKNEIFLIFNEIITTLKKYTYPEFQDKNYGEEYKDFASYISDYDIQFGTRSFTVKNRYDMNALAAEMQNYQQLYSEVTNVYESMKEKNQKFNTFVDEHNNLSEKKLYEDIYNEEITLANKYRNWALIIFAIVGILIVLILLGGIFQNLANLHDEKKYFPINYSISHFIRFLAIFTLTLPAWYLAKEASKHREVAYKAKILGTELASLPYYMNQLIDEQRRDMRIKMADKFFGQELYGNKPIENTDNIEQTRATTDALKALTSLSNSAVSNSKSSS